MCTQLWFHTQVHVHLNGSVGAKTGGRWSRLAGSHSSQRLFCTKSSFHGSLVIKSRLSLTTEIVKSSFDCTRYTHVSVCVCMMLSGTVSIAQHDVVVRLSLEVQEKLPGRGH